LLVLYPNAFRRRYASEMRRDFGDLSREGIEEGGGTELARVWAATLSDLVVTALEERSTMLVMRNAYLTISARIAARLTVAILLIAGTVAMASLAQTPQYEGSSKILIGQDSRDIQQAAPGKQEIQKLQEATKTLAEATQSRPVAEAAIDRLKLSATPEVFLERLNAKPIDNTQFIQLSYTDTDPARAQRVANTVGEVLSEEVAQVNHSANDAITAMLWERAPVPNEPVSPNPLRNGLLVLVPGLILIAGLARLTPNGAASGVGDRDRRTTRSIGRTASGARGTPSTEPVTEAAKEKELLEALRRRGKLTVAGVALETSLTVEEADRMLSALAARGHLEVRAEYGRLLYSLWEGD
jgi:capsular polysaccharide biosynthesis protein